MSEHDKMDSNLSGSEQKPFIHGRIAVFQSTSMADIQYVKDMATLL